MAVEWGVMRGVMWGGIACRYFQFSNKRFAV